MTREEAEAASAKLNDEHPERDQFRWFVCEGERGEWQVARVRLPEAANQRLVRSQQPKQQTPPDRDTGKLPGGIPPWVGPA